MLVDKGGKAAAVFDIGTVGGSSLWLLGNKIQPNHLPRTRCMDWRKPRERDHSVPASAS